MNQAPWHLALALAWALAALPGKAASEPALPAGMAPATSAEPGLPPGLDVGGDKPDTTLENTRADNDLSVSGFWEARLGTRLQDDPFHDDASLRESRLQVDVARHGNSADLKLVADFVWDDLAEDHDIDLDTGQGWLDLRELNLLWRAGDVADLKAGRQVLTWGTGDLIFVNDLFPKDYQSFFLGRDISYLKAPSDALRVTLGYPRINLDLVYTPQFDADRYLDGSRLSFFDPVTGAINGGTPTTPVVRPNDVFEDDEWAGRLYGTLGTLEWALYGYDGFWKSPTGVDPDTRQRTFPRLRVWGLSGQGPVGSGIANLELGWYDSLEDPGGSDPFVPNSELRLLAGYRRELIADLDLGLQYYLVHLQDFDRHRDALPDRRLAGDEYRHTLTLRLDWRVLKQDLRLSLFTFYSPSDEDAYLRLNGRYTIDDSWSLDGGLNYFTGDQDNTFFGQLEDNSNVFAAARYSFSQ
ncbi:MAG: hypothetical protein ABFS23_01275 [Pseudomonadota bacterium]